MSPARLLRAALVATLATAGCADDPATAVPAADLEEAPDLELLFPAITRDSRPPTEIRELEPGDGPARALSDGGVDDGPSDPSVDENAVAEIIAPITQVGFTSTYAYSSGRHEYRGNTGKVSTVATVTFQGAALGSSPASRQEYTPFLVDWGERKSIWAEAYVFTSQKCGLRVDGDSEHAAWWQWFQGDGVSRWGEANATTQAFPPAEQPPCEEAPVEYDFGGQDEGSSSDGSGAVTCWYWVTYDPETGEVYDWQFLYCEGPEEGG